MKKKDKGYVALMGWLVLIDQVSKYLVRSYEPMLDLKVFSLHLVTNTGASFGILKDSNILLIGVSLIVLGWIFYAWRRIQNKLPMSLIIAGIAGNLIDRLVWGHVLDFIDFKFWPVFNLADSLITIGIVWFILA